MNYDLLRDELEYKIIGRIMSLLYEHEFYAKIDVCFRIEIFSDYKHKERVGFIKLITGNGADIISDYSTNLEEFIKPILEYCKQYQ